MISVVITKLKERYNEEMQGSETVITLVAHQRTAPPISKDETQQDYTKRTKAIFDEMNMFQQLHLGYAKLYQDKPQEYRPAFDEY